MILFNQLLKEENSLLNYSLLKNQLFFYFENKYKKLLKEFPEEPEINDPHYMYYEILRQRGKNYKFIFSCINENFYVKNNYKNMFPITSYNHGCYYNSLTYIKKYYSKYTSLDLCYGIVCPENSFDILKEKKFNLDFSTDWFIHAFLLVDKNKIIDPTLKRSYNDYYYFYNIVPETIWKNFSYKENDTNYDAREFANYIFSKVENESYLKQFIDEFANFFNKNRLL